MTPAKLLSLFRGNYLPQSIALFARMTTPPSVARKRLIDGAIRTLIAYGAWDQLEVLYLFAAADSQAARLNWKGTAQSPASLVTTPTFTADRGYASGGAQYLTSPSNLATPTTNDHSFGVWLNAYNFNGGFDVGMAFASYAVRAYNSAGDIAQYYSATSVAPAHNIAALDGLGFRALSRSSSAGFTGQKDATQTAFTETSTTGLGAAKLGILSTGTGADISNGRVAAAFAGVALTGTQLNILRQALSAYLTPIGAA